MEEMSEETLEKFRNPPTRESLGCAYNEVVMWDPDSGDYAVVKLVAGGVDPNAGGSPSPVEDGLEEAKTGE